MVAQLRSALHFGGRRPQTSPQCMGCWSRSRDLERGTPRATVTVKLSRSPGPRAPSDLGLYRSLHLGMHDVAFYSPLPSSAESLLPLPSFYAPALESGVITGGMGVPVRGGDKARAAKQHQREKGKAAHGGGRSVEWVYDFFLV